MLFINHFCHTHCHVSGLFLAIHFAPSFSFGYNPRPLAQMCFMAWHEGPSEVRGPCQEGWRAVSLERQAKGNEGLRGQAVLRFWLPLRFHAKCSNSHQSLVKASGLSTVNSPKSIRDIPFMFSLQIPQFNSPILSLSQLSSTWTKRPINQKVKPISQEINFLIHKARYYWTQVYLALRKFGALQRTHLFFSPKHFCWKF